MFIRPKSFRFISFFLYFRRPIFRTEHSVSETAVLLGENSRKYYMQLCPLESADCNQCVTKT
jgi:hypothetical protein